MLNVDALKQLKQLKTDIKASRNLAEGVVKGSSNKFGFVTLDSGKDVFLPADEMQKVLPGDRIEVEVKKEPKNKTFALVERLIKSPVKEFYGKYVVKGKAHFVDADIPGLSRWIFIPPQKRKNAKASDLVKCRLTQHPIKQGKPQAAVLEVLGNESSPGIEWDYALAKHNIAQGWSAKSEAALAELTESKIEAAKAGRTDLSATPFVTIDAPSTQDLDDALWAERDGEGWRMQIAIADPGALLSGYPELEQEALARSCSVYFPGRAIAMLPSALGSDLCSLQAERDRLAKVLDLRIAASGEITTVQIERAWVRSRAKLSYREVADLLEGSSEHELAEEISTSLQALDQATQALRSWRQQHALVNNGRSEFYLELNEEQKISAIHPKAQTMAHIMVEEAMVAANVSIARFIKEHNIPGIYVAHDGIREDRIDGIKRALQPVLSEADLASIDSLEGFRGLLQKLEESGVAAKYHHLVVKQLSRSYFTAEALPHFGLGVEAYTTFTSPLRKANDYLLHRQLDRFLTDSKVEKITDASLESLAEGVQAARTAVNEVEQWLKCQFMAGNKDEHKAEVIRTFSSGFQVRLLENGIEGFVSTRELEGKYSFHQDSMELVGSDASYALGQEVAVRLKQIDWSRKQMQFEPV